MSRWLLLDADGTLVPDGGTTVNPVLATAVRELAASDTLRLGWYTGREREAAAMLGPQIGMADAEVVPIPDDVLDTPSHIKLEGLRRWLAGHEVETVLVLDDDPPEKSDWPEGVRFIACPNGLNLSALQRAVNELMGQHSPTTQR